MSQNAKQQGRFVESGVVDVYSTAIPIDTFAGVASVPILMILITAGFFSETLRATAHALFGVGGGQHRRENFLRGDS